MRHRRVLPVTFFVAAAHGWVMWEGSPWTALISAAPEPAAPAFVQAVWVTHEAVAPVAAPVPALMPEPPPPRKAALPKLRQTLTPNRATSPPSIALPAPADASPDDSVHLSALAEPAISEELASPIVAADEVAPTHRPAAPTGPQLQVHSSTGDAVTVALPTDGSALHQQVLLRFKVHGFVKGMEYHAQAQLSWRTDGTTYEARQSISAFLLGSMEQTSTGRLTAQGLQPVQFTDRRFAKHRSVVLDWDTQQARFDPVREPAAIGPGAQDRLSVFLQLAAMLQALPALRAPGTRIDIPTLGSRRMQMWTFVVENAETLELPSGPIGTLRLQRQPQAGDDEKALLWVDPTQGYVPVRIHMQERNGDVMDLSRSL